MIAASPELLHIYFRTNCGGVVLLMIRVMLADDHQIIRKGLQGLLSAEPDFEIVGEAGDGLETVRLAELLLPDILVLDLTMSGINGLEVTRRLNKKCYGIGIIILSIHSDEAYVVEALRLGARAYVLKESSPEELVRAIREVAAGHCYRSSSLSNLSIEDYFSAAK
jgi:two-component system, NarL family, response regulator NreC